jgi:DNA-binding NarL/FixJ family response regulator
MRGSTRLRDLVRLDGTIRDLLQTTVDALPRLPGERFSVANRYTMAHGCLTPGELVMRGPQDFSKLARAFQAITEQPPAFLGEHSALTSTTHANAWNESAAEAARISECADFVGTVVRVGAGRFAMAGSGMAEKTSLPRSEPRMYRAINRLLAINLRVRDALEGGSALELGDAVCGPDGSLLEARPAALQTRDARRALAELVRMRERKLGFSPLSDAEALARWQDLSAGRYAMLDHVDTDQRRYIVCFRVEADSADTFALSPIEQTVLEQILSGARNKSIASMLGVSSPHVSGVAQRALRKLGVRSFAELTGVLRARNSLVLGELELGGESLLALGYREVTADSLSQLTEAERKVAHALVGGVSHRGIALERGVSARTVASQAASIYRKLGVSGRRELTAKLSRA